MSQVKIQGNASGTGIFTVSAPNSNTDRTLTLPDVAGTIAVQGGAGVGKVLQVVQAVTTTPVTSNSSTIVDIVSASITPSSASSKVLAISAFGFLIDDANDSFHEANGIAYLYRNSTVINGQNYLVSTSGETRSQALRGHGGFSLLDSPATTSSITYKVSMASGDGAYSMTMPYGTFSGVASSCSLILMEIAA